MNKATRSVMVAAGAIVSIALVTVPGVESLSGRQAPGESGRPKKEYTEFEAKWRETVSRGTIDEFVQLMDSELAKKTVSGWNDLWEGTTPAEKHYYAGTSDIFHVFSWKKAEPWLTVVDYPAASYTAVPGGMVNIGLFQTFTEPLQPSSIVGMTRAHVDFESKEKPPGPHLHSFVLAPSWAHQFGYALERSGNNQMVYGTIGDREKGIALTWLTPRLWVTVPGTTTIGKLPITLSAVAEGPQGKAQSETKAVSERAVLDVVARPAAPTREQIRALWACALEVGHRVTEWKETDRGRPEFQVLRWIDSVLTAASPTATQADRLLVSQLRSHPLYTTNVLVHLAAKQTK